MDRATLCWAAIAVALAARVVAPDLGGAVLPLAGSPGRQIVQNMLISGVKRPLIGSLSALECKGATIAGLVAKSDIRCQSRKHQR